MKELKYQLEAYANAASMFGEYDEVLEKDPDDEYATNRRDYYLNECFEIDSIINSIKRVYGLS